MNSLAHEVMELYLNIIKIKITKTAENSFHSFMISTEIKSVMQIVFNLDIPIKSGLQQKMK